MAVLTRHKSTVYGLVTDLTNIQNAVGLTNSLTYQPVAGSSYISTATSVRNASDLLDAALHNVSDELAGEVTRATTAEGVITSNLNAEIQRATTAEGTLTTNLSNEVQRATTTEGTLQDNLDAEILRATQAEEALTTASNTAINAEVLRATQAEELLQSNLDAEILRATTAEGTLTTNLNNEVQRATAAEGTLTTNLGAEVTRATTAEGTLQDNIDAEALRATTAEGTLTAGLANLSGVTDAGAARTNLSVYSNAEVDAAIAGATANVGDVTLNGVQTLTNKTLTGYTETVYNLTGTNIAVANGTIQTKTLAANTTFTESLADGQSVILGITAGAYSVTWPSVTWAKVGGSGVAPTLTSSGVNWIILWQAGGIVRGSFMGTA